MEEDLKCLLFLDLRKPEYTGRVYGYEKCLLCEAKPGHKSRITTLVTFMKSEPTIIHNLACKNVL
jgi:hypothetical protein